MVGSLNRPATIEERVLIERAKRLDERACQRLYEWHSQYVYTQIRRLVGDDHLAEDLSQDAWRRIFGKLHLFEYRSSFRTWAGKVARNVVYNNDSHPIEQELLDDSLVGLDQDLQPDARMLDQLTIEEAIEQALPRLPPIQRRVLLLHDREGLSHKEIAEELGIDSGTSRSNLFKARARLRKELGGVDPREVN